MSNRITFFVVLCSVLTVLERLSGETVPLLYFITVIHFLSYFFNISLSLDLLNENNSAIVSVMMYNDTVHIPKISHHLIVYIAEDTQTCIDM